MTPRLGASLAAGPRFGAHACRPGCPARLVATVVSERFPEYVPEVELDDQQLLRGRPGPFSAVASLAEPVTGGSACPHPDARVATLDPAGSDVHGEADRLRAHGTAALVNVPHEVPAWVVTDHQQWRGLLAAPACRRTPAAPSRVEQRGDSR